MSHRRPSSFSCFSPPDPPEVDDAEGGALGINMVSSAPDSIVLINSSCGKGTGERSGLSIVQFNAMSVDCQDGIHRSPLYPLRSNSNTDIFLSYATCLWLPGAMVARLASIASVPKGCRFESCGGHGTTSSYNFLTSGALSHGSHQV